MPDAWRELAAGADAADTAADWPANSLAAAARLGAAGWAIPTEYGGTGLPTADYLRRTESLAAACLTTAFILSQRDAAIRRFLLHASPTVLRQWLPRLAAGECYTTVGLSQLTTSRQFGRSAVAADPLPDGGYRVSGQIPWVTGADRASVLVAGGALEDGRQVLFLLHCDTPGMTVGDPMPLSCLLGSRTTSVRLEGVEVPAEDVLAGPAERVLVGPSGGPGGLETSCLALGLAGAAAELLAVEAAERPEVRPTAESVEAERRTVRELLLLAGAGNLGASADVISLRVRATRLALSATQAALTAAKGAGFVRPHPAQRLARQALFFLVWSCPRPAAEGLMAGLAPGCELEP